jgi:hypothetical protein
MFFYMMIIGSLMLSGRNLPALMYLSCHFGLPKAHFVFVFLFFFVTGWPSMCLDRISYVATVPSRDLPVPIAPILPLPPLFNTAASCGRFWIDGRLPGPSDVPPFPSPSSGQGNEIGFKIWEGGLRLSVVGYRVRMREWLCERMV